MKQILSILLLLAASVVPSWGQDKKPFPTSYLDIDQYPDSVLTKYGDSEKYNRHMKMLKGGWTYTLDKKTNKARR